MGRRRTLAATAVLVALGSLILGACGGASSSDPEVTGPRAQAVEKLRDYGLTRPQAACIAEALGAQTVVEATDLNALVDSQPYRDAAKKCIDG